MRRMCLPEGLDDGNLQQFNQVILRRFRTLRREPVYRSGDPVGETLYVVRVGGVKTCHGGVDQQQVTGFHMSGEMLGLEALPGASHDGSALALEDSEICAISYPRLERLCDVVTPLRRHFHTLLMDEIRREQRVSAMLRNSRADQRFAAFLLDLSARYAARGYSSTRFRLTMSRQEIGDFLGLTAESISRLLRNFRSAQLVAVERRQVLLNDMPGLRALAQGAAY